MKWTRAGVPTVLSIKPQWDAARIGHLYTWRFCAVLLVPPYSFPHSTAGTICVKFSRGRPAGASRATRSVSLVRALLTSLPICWVKDVTRRVNLARRDANTGLRNRLRFGGTEFARWLRRLRTCGNRIDTYFCDTAIGSRNPSPYSQCKSATQLPQNHIECFVSLV